MYIIYTLVNASTYYENNKHSWSLVNGVDNNEVVIVRGMSDLCIFANGCKSKVLVCTYHYTLLTLRVQLKARV